MSDPPRVGALARVSTEDQTKNTSLEGQLRLMKRVSAENGWGVVRVYQEQESGTLSTISRHVTAEALNDLENDEFDILMLYDMTRYGRDIEFQHNMLKRVIKAGKQLQFATHLLKYDRRTGRLTPDSETTFNTLGFQSSAELSMITRRLYNGKVETVEAGRQINRSQMPFGYHIVRKNDVIRGEYPEGSEGQYIVIEKHRALIVELYERYAGGESLRSCMRWLTSTGVPSPTGNAEWSYPTVRHILANDVYKGSTGWGKTRRVVDESRTARGLRAAYTVPVPEDQWFTIETPAIVTTELWDRVQQRLASNREEHSGRRDRKYLLTGLLRCPECGLSMQGAISSSYPHYVCTAAKQWKKGNGHSKMPSLPMKRLDDRVLDFVRAVIFEPRRLKAAIAEYEARLPPVAHRDARPALDRKLRAIETKERAAARAKVEAIAESQNPAPFNELLSEYARERLAIEQAIAALQPKPQLLSRPAALDAIDDFRAFLDAGPDLIDTAVKRDVLRSLIKSVTPRLEGGALSLTVVWPVESGNLVIEFGADNALHVTALNRT